MKNNSYTATIAVAQSPKEVFNAINDVTKWWSEDFEGNSTRMDDEFIIHHPNQHYSKQKLVEVFPAKKLVWLVTESKLNWLMNDKEEWTGTKMIFEVSTKENQTLLHFTHDGLTPEKECYTMCQRGWDVVIKEWLSHLITTGKPSEEMAKAVEIRRQHFEDKPEHKDFHRTIAVEASAEEAFKKIAEVDKWWAKSFSGNALDVGDTFRIEFGSTWVNFKITEAVPAQKIVWTVTDSYLPWLSNKTEWNNTQVVFEISSANNQTKVNFTHVGLAPGIECYEKCEQGWTRFATISLPRFISEGKGLPE